MSQEAPHILVVSSWYPNEQHPFLGNFVERHAQLLGTEYQVTVINVQCREGISVSQIETNQKGNITEITVSYPNGNLLSRFRNRSKVFAKAAKQLKGIDLIIGHVLLPHGWLFLKALKILKCPLIWVEHGSYFRSDKKRKWSTRERILRRSVVASSACIVAVSETLKRDMQEYIPNREIKVIGNHVDDKLFKTQPTSKGPTTKFLHVSTLDENTKNPRGIIDACRLLKRENNDFEFTIVSDEDKSSLQSYADECGLSDRISFEGPVEWNNIPEYYYQSDAFVLNSEYETFSIVLAEALSTGTPVITTKVGIANELTSNVMISVEKNNPESLKNAMLTLMETNKTFDSSEIGKSANKYHSASILNQWKTLIKQYVK